MSFHCEFHSLNCTQIINNPVKKALLQFGFPMCRERRTVHMPTKKQRTKTCNNKYPIMSFQTGVFRMDMDRPRIQLLVLMSSSVQQFGRKSFLLEPKHSKFL